MKLKDLIQKIESDIPTEVSYDWDNVGLLVGDRDAEIKRIHICLDVTTQEIEAAIDDGCDLIISHHPMIFSSIKRIEKSDILGNKIYEAIRHGIAIYAMHTNYDAVKMGELSGEIFGLNDVHILDTYIEDVDDIGIGVVGTLDSDLTIREIANRTKDKFNLDAVRVCAPSDCLEQIVHTVAISPGSGKSEIRNAMKSGAEVLITGDIDHHSGLDAYEDGIIVIDAGHFGIEHIFIDDMKGYLSQISSEFVITTSDFVPLVTI